MGSLSIRVRNTEDVSILDLDGKIVIGEDCMKFRGVVQELIDAGAKKILVLFSNISYVDAAGLGELVSALARINKSGGVLRLVSFSPKLVDLFMITRLLTTFDVYDNEQQAITSFNTPNTGAFSASEQASVKVFLCYAREDKDKVEQLYKELFEAGFSPWMDSKNILPGQQWELCIINAIRQSDFFLICLSTNSVNKRGYLQKEIKHAIEIWQEKLDTDIYVIPIRLEECEVPPSLSRFQWTNLFEQDGLTKLLDAIEKGTYQKK